MDGEMTSKTASHGDNFQRVIGFLSTPDKGHQNAAMVIRIRGAEDAPRLAQAFECVVMASDTPRVVVVGDSHQVVLTHDLPAATHIVQDTSFDFEAWATAQAKRPIDLSRACYVS